MRLQAVTGGVTGYRAAARGVLCVIHWSLGGHRTGRPTQLAGLGHLDLDKRTSGCGRRLSESH